jgi:VWFA-related protein
VISLALPLLVGAGERVRFTSPEDGALLMGPTRFCFEVSAGAETVERIDVYLGGRLVGSAAEPEFCVDWDAPPGSSGPDAVGVAFAGDEVVDRCRLTTLEAPFGHEVRVSAVQLYPVVLDGRGRYVQGLQKGDFEVLDQGKAIDIEVFAPEPASLSVAVLLDTSSSMFDRLGLVQEAACRFVDRLEDGDRISVSAFHHAIRHMVPLTDDRARAKEGIRALRPRGGTAIYDAVIQAFDLLEGVSGRRALILFSDGKDERSLASLRDAVRTAHQVGAIVYTVGTGDDYASLQARDQLRTLSAETGGEAYFVDRLDDLSRVFDAVIDHLRAQYMLSYTPPDGPTGLRPVKVRVHRAGLEVRCRQSYYHSKAVREEVQARSEGAFRHRARSAFGVEAFAAVGWPSEKPAWGTARTSFFDEELPRAGARPRSELPDAEERPRRRKVENRKNHVRRPTVEEAAGPGAS